MDTLTHGLAGALAGRAIAGDRQGTGPTPRAAAIVTAVACVFPDVDFIIGLADPYAYLTLHRLFTHTFVLLPLWAVALAWLASRFHGSVTMRAWLPYTAAGIALHILIDLFNLWPLLPLWPLSDASVAIPVLFVIDLVYTGLVVAGLGLSVLWRVRTGAVIGLGAVALYTALQFPLDAHAGRTVAALPGVEGPVEVSAQPLSPFHRRVVERTADGYRWAFLAQFVDAPRELSQDAGFWRTLAAGYRPVHALDWRQAVHPGYAEGFVVDAWMRPELERFRAWSRMPYLYAVESEDGRVCAWFADVRFTMPALPPAFRYGMCRADDGAWMRHRRGRW